LISCKWNVRDNSPKYDETASSQFINLLSLLLHNLCSWYTNSMA